MFGFIKNILSSDKSDSTAPQAKKQKGYYLELDDSATPETPNGSQPAETAPVAETSIAEVQETVTVIEPATEETKPEPATEETKPEPATAEAQPEPVTEEAQPAKTKTKKSKIKRAAKPEPIATPAPVAPTPEKIESEPEKTFATKYLISTGNSSRRRPGANMSSFLEMARQIKTPNK